MPTALRLQLFWRIVPLMVVLYIVAFLDRTNLGLAKLRMKDSLPWSEAEYGFGYGIFFVGYWLLEIPGALLVEHWSARKWFARILVTWGICSMATAFVQTPWQFYLARFCLGLAEAGFFPGVIVYFTHWFPRAERARALSGFVLGVPLSGVIGARLTSYLLAQHWEPYESWQWVFLIEGAPAILFGLIVPFVLTDRPSQARWLSPADRDWLQQTLERERLEASRAGKVSVLQALRQPAVWLLSLGILAANTGGYALSFWLPTIVKSTLQADSTEALSDDQLNSASLNVIALIQVCSLCGVWLSGQSSDRTGDRKWHCVAGMALTGTFLAISTLPGQSTGAMWAWMYLMGFFTVFWAPPFWVLPTLSLSASAAAVAIAVINICANVAGFLGSPVVGYMRDLGYTNEMCLLALAGCYVTGGAIIAALRVTRPPVPQPSSEKLA
jgi:ACS family tartrate transporter-like MFS transporter